MSDCERSESNRGRQMRPRGAQKSSFHNLLLDHTNYVLCNCLKINNCNMITRSSQRIFDPMHYTGFNTEGRLHLWNLLARNISNTIHMFAELRLARIPRSYEKMFRNIRLVYESPQLANSKQLVEIQGSLSADNSHNTHGY